MSVTIWHNARCSKSRQALELLRDRGVEPQVVSYLTNPPSATEIRRVLGLMKLPARSLLRKAEPAYREQELDKEKSEDALISAMAHNPVLIERPVVITDEAAVIGRPPEAVLSVI